MNDHNFDNIEEAKTKLCILPEKPGVYLMKDSRGNIIYVGKAKVLKNRVRSYFTGSHNEKTQKLISEISDFEYIVTSSETEALLLECNLIKKYNPRYNIMLKDDKSYPYLLLTSEKHPRIMVTRTVNKKWGKYFGPYPNATAARETARLLNRLFPFRKCNQIPDKACLYYHIGQCLGPCIEKINSEQYLELVNKASQFLKGNKKDIINWLEEKMNQASAELQFEQAKEYRDIIQDIRAISEKQNITLNDFRNRDIISYYANDELISIQVFIFRQGKLITRDGFLFPYFNEEPEEAFISFLVQYYGIPSAIPEEICIPEIETASVIDILPVTIPRRGKNLELVKLAGSNAQTVLEEKLILEAQRENETAKALEALACILNIETPNTIEAVDISSLAGTNVVGGLIKFVQGRPARSDYRKFNLHPMPYSDDTAYINQLITRRYSRLLVENIEIPDLVLVDGGKGQVNAAVQALHSLGVNIPVAGMVKNDCHQTRSLIDINFKEVDLNSYPAAFKLIQQIQEEVHRFAITFHRQKRQKLMTASELDNIPGIGASRKRLLLRSFESLEKIKNSSIEELKSSGLPQNIAENVYNYFQNKDKKQS